MRQTFDEFFLLFSASFCIKYKFFISSFLSSSCLRDEENFTRRRDKGEEQGEKLIGMFFEMLRNSSWIKFI